MQGTVFRGGLTFHYC